MKEDTQSAIQNFGDSPPPSVSDYADVRSESMFSINLRTESEECPKELSKSQLPLKKPASLKTSKPRTGMIAFVYLFLFALGIVLILILDSNTGSDKSLIMDEELSSKYTTPSSEMPYTFNITSSYSTSTTTDDLVCVNLAWINDGLCDDDSNILSCDYDGGDCCLDKIEGLCFHCTCHLDGKRHQGNLTMLEEDGSAESESLVLLLGGSFSQVSHVINPSSNEFYSLPAYPHPCNKPVGYFTNNSIIVCAGRDHIWDTEHPLTTLSDLCYQLVHNEGWIPLDFQISSAKYEPAFININDKLWILGGGDGYTIPVTTTEYLDLKNHGVFLPGPDLPIGLHSHCVTQLSDTSILIMGGYAQVQGLYSMVVKNTFIFDFDIDQWSTGPPSIYRRGTPGCATFRIDNEFAVIVVGGYNPDTKFFMNSSELMLPKNDEKWELGPELPSKVDGPAMVTLYNEVYLIGGSKKGPDFSYPSSNIFKLIQPIGGKGFQWLEMPYALTYPRSFFSAIKVPAEYIRTHYLPLYQ